MSTVESVDDTHEALVSKSLQVAELNDIIDRLTQDLAESNRENNLLHEALASADEDTQALVHKSLQVAELTENVDKLSLELADASRENVALRQENEKQYEMLQELSRIVRAGARPTASTEAMEISAQSGEILSPGDAVDLTISNLRQQVEGLEDERVVFIKQILNLEAKVKELEKIDEAREIKIKCLENVYQMNEECDKARRRSSLNTISVTSVTSNDSSISSKDEYMAAFQQDDSHGSIVDVIPEEGSFGNEEHHFV